MNIPTPKERAEARRKLLGDGFNHNGPVLGYIGGVTERKGYRQLISALEGDSDVFLLMGGLGAEGFMAPTLSGRFKSMGLTDEMRTFYAACDVFAVPSYFDPCPLVVFEAAALGLPVIATDGVGNLTNLLENRCGAEWKFNTPITPIVHDLMARRTECQAGAARMNESLSIESWKTKLRTVYEEILAEKGLN
jgi:glycosyltransferase involved in cell wall biosynthesis